MRRYLGFCASGEQFGPQELLDQCVLAEEAGFGAILASDHFHPWTPQQGQSPFVSLHSTAAIWPRSGRSAGGISSRNRPFTGTHCMRWPSR